MAGEIWKDIAGFEGLYQVSNLGRIRRLDSLGLPCRVLKAHKEWEGFYALNLSRSRQLTHVWVHTLVAETFLGPKPDNMQIVHLNGDKADNRAENLCYLTLPEIRHRFYTADNGKRKLSREDVFQIYERADNGETSTRIAKDFGVTISHISRIRNGKTFAWLRKEYDDARASR